MRRNAICAWLLFTASCASTRVYSGKPPGETASGYDARWHAAFFFGGVALHDDYQLDEICPEGWSEVKVEPDALTFLASLGTLFIYMPSRLTVVCAAGEGSARPRLREYPPP
ncbi:MAG: hypothetical protein ACOY0T_23660 [Myxococcota bacterium]